MRPALFLDRDGMLVAPRHSPSRPEELTLAQGIGPLLRTFQTSGWEIVVVTNQSGIDRGLFTPADLEQSHERLRAMLRVWGVEPSGIYACPHRVDGIIPELASPCACLPPQPGMLLRAAADLDIELARSWMVGDILDAVEAGNRAGCRTVLVDLGTERAPECRERWPRFVARSTSDALQRIAFAEELVPDRPNPAMFQPRRWYSVATVSS
jgi:D-glycero-D-manno-heptose 1,7-bisphosphate phosphatase